MVSLVCKWFKLVQFLVFVCFSNTYYVTLALHLAFLRRCGGLIRKMLYYIGPNNSLKQLFPLSSKMKPVLRTLSNVICNCPVLTKFYAHKNSRQSRSEIVAYKNRSSSLKSSTQMASLMGGSRGKGNSRNSLITTVKNGRIFLA